jgi:hypothetical protein
MRRARSHEQPVVDVTVVVVRRRAAAALVRIVAAAAVCASASCSRDKLPARLALDCKQVDGWSRPFHREFLLDLAEQRAWGDQAARGIYEIEERSSTASRVTGEVRSRCPPDDPEHCRVQRVVSYEFDLREHQMIETMRNDVDGSVVQTLHYDCESLPLARSLVARKLAEQAER